MEAAEDSIHHEATDGTDTRRAEEKRAAPARWRWTRAEATDIVAKVDNVAAKPLTDRNIVIHKADERIGFILELLYREANS